jgi:hypothetical protein
MLEVRENRAHLRDSLVHIQGSLDRSSILLEFLGFCS